MKRLLVLVPFLLLAVGCAKEPEAPLPSIDENAYTAKLTPENSLITAEQTTEAYNVSISSEEDSNTKYEMTIGAPCYLSTKAHEFIMAPGSYIKSVSTYVVDRIIVDFYSGKGVNFGVYTNTEGTGDALPYHESTIAPEDPDDEGTVYEYQVSGSAWCLKNITEFNKPGIYSITIVFSK